MRKRKKVIWTELSRHRRGDDTAKLRWAEKGALAARGQFFVTYEIYPDEPTWPGGCDQWSDIYFTSRKDRCLFYNATVLTARQAFCDLAENLAMDNVDAKLKDGDRRFELRSEGNELHIDKDVIPELGRTWFDAVDEEHKRILLARDMDIFEEVKLEPGYGYGVGITMVVDAESLDTPTVNKLVTDFLDRGEIFWRAEKPVPREHLDWPWWPVTDIHNGGRCLAAGL